MSESQKTKEMINPRNFDDDLVRMENVDCPWEFVEQYLGTVDADREWDTSPDEAYKTFLNTRSFEDFKHKDALVLLGRTGTGKTAILRCLCEEVNRNKSDDYDIATIISIDEILTELMHVSNDFSNPTIIYELANFITIYINCHIMRLLLRNSLRDGSKMTKYLKDNNFYDILTDSADSATSGMSKLQRILSAASKAPGKLGNVANNVLAISEMVSIITEKGYKEALQEMKEELKKRKALILIDTSNHYDMRNSRLVICIKALVETCFRYYNTAESNHVYVKMAIPSEIHSQILESLPGKHQGNAVVIQWKTNDLLKMIAIRLLKYCNENSKSFITFEDKYEYKDFYDNNPDSAKNAKRFLHEILPKSCGTSLNFSFDTLGYCVRHTLKKPRELMIIFNYFIKQIHEKKKSHFFIENPDSIRNVLHATQEEMISGALSMYTESYPDILRACEIVLQNQAYCFKKAELKNRLKEAEALSSKNGYDQTDITRILLESGLIGKVNTISFLQVEEDGSEKATVKNSVQVVKAKFEYQIKGRLFFDSDEWYVLHPMCYEHFSCRVGKMTLVYPGEIDNLEELQSVKLKSSTNPVLPQSLH